MNEGYNPEKQRAAVDATMAQATRGEAPQRWDAAFHKPLEGEVVVPAGASYYRGGTVPIRAAGDIVVEPMQGC